MVLIALLVAAAPVQPAAANAIIWAGGKTREEAQARLDGWPKDEARWSQSVRLKAGFPKLVASDALPGLKPGFHVVLLGICNAEQARARTRTLKELYPEVYWRPLTGPHDESCPELLCTATDEMIAVPPGDAELGC